MSLPYDRELTFRQRCPRAWRGIFAGWASPSHDAYFDGGIGSDGVASYFAINAQSRTTVRASLEVLCIHDRLAWVP